MPVLYLRVSDEIAEYVRGVAERSGLSLAKTAETLLRACKDQDYWTIELKRIVKDDGHAQA